MKKTASFLLSMLSNGGVSSKRVWGSVVMLMLCASYVWCTIKNTPMVDDTESFLALAGLLLGLDTVMSPFNKTKEYENNEGTTYKDSAEG